MHKCNVDFYPDIKNFLYKQCSSLFKVTNRHSEYISSSSQSTPRSVFNLERINVGEF